jgi:pimeloyl-ACP methyl ester carboxylesterase
VRIRYLHSLGEDPDGALPVVFVPGITDVADEYTETFEELSPRPLIVVEMRGRGGSDSPPTGYSAAEQADDVEAVLDDAGVDRFHLMTFSRGTTPALEVALRRPGRVVTVSMGDYPAAEIGLPASFVESMWGSRWRGRPMPERVERHVLEQIQAASVDRDLVRGLAALGVPVLMAWGSEGGLLTEERMMWHRTALADLELVTVAGSGHDIFRPDRRAYPRAVADFIDRRAGSAGPAVPAPGVA